MPTSHPTVTTVRRTTLNLTARGATSMDEAMELSGANQTDVVNKALAVYAWLLRVQDAPGGYVLVREDADSSPERIRLV